MRMSPGRSHSRKSRRSSNSTPTRIGSPPTRRALAVARELAAEFAQEAAQRDRDRRLPAKELDRFSGAGLWAITVPKAYGGAGVSFATLAEVIAIISAADPSLRQLPQNHLAALDAIRVTASEEQRLLWFGRALQGYCLGNVFSEAKSKRVGGFETTARRDGPSFVVNGEKFYATGALFAHFIHIGAVDENGNVHLAIAPRAAPGLTIIDNWSSFGPRTTASGNVLIDNVRVGREAVIPAYLGGVRPSSNGSVSQIIQAAVDAGIARGAIEETIHFVRNHVRPWIDSRQAHGYEDVFTIAQIGDLEVKLHAAEALLERAGRAIDGILDDPSEEAVAETAVKWPRPRFFPPRSRSLPPRNCMSLAVRARRLANTISTAIGGTPAPTRCTIPCGGNISMSATTSSTASRPRAMPGADVALLTEIRLA
jgi:SfnB family sulfur acquisition oxidoreductase